MTDIDTARFRSASTAARKAQHHFPADCLMEAADTIDALRARLAELEAERQGWESDFRDMNAAHTAAEARLAEVEAELADRNDAALEEGRSTFWRLRAEAAEARLAEVLALCDQTGGGPDAWLYVIDVLAAARGEGDRPAADCRHDGSNGTCAECRLTHLYGEGDRPAEPWPACRDHHEVQHRDGKPPWCKKCGWNRGRPAIPPRLIRGEGDRGE